MDVAVTATATASGKVYDCLSVVVAAVFRLWFVANKAPHRKIVVYGVLLFMIGRPADTMTNEKLPCRYMYAGRQVLATSITHLIKKLFSLWWCAYHGPAVIGHRCCCYWSFIAVYTTIKRELLLLLVSVALASVHYFLLIVRSTVDQLAEPCIIAFLSVCLIAAPVAVLLLMMLLLLLLLSLLLLLLLLLSVCLFAAAVIIIAVIFTIAAAVVVCLFICCCCCL